MTNVEQNLADVQRRIRDAACRTNRDPAAIELVAVSKKVPASLIGECLKTGLVKSLGENRVQEWLDKKREIPAGVNWHLVGHLQLNKVKYLTGEICLIHSLDSLKLAATLDRHFARLGIAGDVLVQVNVSGEETKFGLPPAGVENFLREAAYLRNIRIRGLMTIAPLAGEEVVRPVFRFLRELSSSLFVEGVSLDYLSMGMSSDFEIAIEEGANVLRIGTAIFGPRQ